MRWEAGASRGDLRRYCSTASILNPLTPDGCHFRFRFASVPDLTVGGSQPNPVSNFMREAFDPQGLVRHLKASGVGPETDWWRADPRLLFAGMPDPLRILVANTLVQVADSRDCPALVRALEAADQRPFTTRMDFDGVGRDDRGGPPAPHAAYTTYWLNINAPGVMGASRIEGAGDEIANHLLPVIKPPTVARSRRAGGLPPPPQAPAACSVRYDRSKNSDGQLQPRH